MNRDNRNGSTQARWPKVPKIASEQFQQSFAVAQLAVELWENKMARVVAPLEKEKLKDSGPKEFLKEAWELIERACAHVLREQSNAEYLAAHGGSHEAAENVVERVLRASRVPFKKLCDPNRKKGASELIKLNDAGTDKTIEEEWKVYRGEGGERAFNNLFWAYWSAKSILADKNKWKEYGEALLALWKKDGVAPNDFLALAKFRRERDKKRAANLKKKPKRKRRQLMPKSRA